MNRTIGIVIVILAVLGLALYMNAQRQMGPNWNDGTYTGEPRGMSAANMAKLI